MMLDGLIKALEAEAGHDRTLPLGFGNPHSYRGYYGELAFEPLADVTVSQMLADARTALGTTYEGWKGGQYTMRAGTECWLEKWGGGGGDVIGPVLLALLMAADEVCEETAATLRSLAGDCKRWDLS